ncbi:MAG: hypothetical protein IAE78_13750 [Myxococcus sp.]|nr:hypothetical protein [Myxococcus sp.]
MARRRVQKAQIFSLAEARLARRLSTYRERLDRVIRSNKRAIGRLYTSGSMFTKAGARAGRDLLTAHEHLLRVVTLLDRFDDTGDVPAPRSARAVEAIFTELDTLLERTGQLTAHTSELMGDLKPER